MISNGGKKGRRDISYHLYMSHMSSTLYTHTTRQAYNTTPLEDNDDYSINYSDTETPRRKKPKKKRGKKLATTVTKSAIEASPDLRKNAAIRRNFTAEDRNIVNQKGRNGIYDERLRLEKEQEFQVELSQG